MVKQITRQKLFTLLLTLLTVLAFTCIGVFSPDAFQAAESVTSGIITNVTSLYPKLYFVGMVLSAIVFFLSKDDKKVGAAKTAMISMTIVYAIIFFLGKNSNNPLDETLTGLGL